RRFNIQMLMLRIRERPYEIWVASGGDAEENWLRAEAELLKNSASRPADRPSKKNGAQRPPKRRRRREDLSPSALISLLLENTASPQLAAFFISECPAG